MLLIHVLVYKISVELENRLQNKYLISFVSSKKLWFTKLGSSSIYVHNCRKITFIVLGVFENLHFKNNICSPVKHVQVYIYF